MKPEDKAREQIDQKLTQAGWIIQDRKELNLAAPRYDAEHQVPQVRTDGTIKWKGVLIFISETLCGQPVGLAEQENGLHIVRFMHRELGVLDRHQKLQPFAPPRARFKRVVVAHTEGSTGGYTS